MTASRLTKITNGTLNLIRKCWRPITCLGIAGSVIVHGIYIPIVTGQAVNMAELAALITAATAAFAVREWGKIKGTTD